MLPSIVNVSGLNRISQTIFTNVAGAIRGMVAGNIEKPVEEKPLINAYHPMRNDRKWVGEEMGYGISCEPSLFIFVTRQT